MVELEVLDAQNFAPYFVSAFQTSVALDSNGKERLTKVTLPEVKDLNEDEVTISVEGLGNL